jgi:opacity protein-like surface antigen
MPRRWLIGSITTALGFAPVHRLAAQDASDSAAYRALTQTPPSALPMPMDISITGARDRMGVTVRYGIMSFDNREYVHNFGVGLTIPLGSTTLGVTGGYYWPNCNGLCEGHGMAGVNFSQNLVRIPLGTGAGSGALNIGSAWEAGYAKQNATLVSGRLSIPISLVPAQHSLTVIPYVAPGVGGGLVKDDSGTEVGLLFTLGAGIGLRTSRGFTAHAGISRAFLSTGNWLAGLGITIGS